jgi:CBS domain-containing protein
MRIDALHTMTLSRLMVISIDASLRAAASALSSPHIGLLVVCDKNSKAAGVVSKSDLVCHLASAGVAEAPIGTLMSRNIISCRPEDDLYATWQGMAAQNLQNIPVLSTDSKPLGVLDIRDALKVLFEQEEHQEQLLINYIAGVGYQ